jgi:hypothetical protein
MTHTTQKVEGVRYLDFGIRKVSGRWVVDHIPSESCVTGGRGCRTEAKAREMCQQLYRIGSWSSTDPKAYTRVARRSIEVIASYAVLPTHLTGIV